MVRMEYVPDPLTKEVDAMAVIGQVLQKLPDAAARQRVLRWAVERFSSEAAAAHERGTVRPAVPANSVTGDTALAVDSLDDMFETSDAVETPDDFVEPAERLETERRSFTAAFRRFTGDWKGATI